MNEPTDYHFDESLVPRVELVDVDELLMGDSPKADWLIEGVIARGRQHAIYSPAKAGKSLLMLDLFFRAVCGRTNLVLFYLDWEQTEDDLKERLEDLGYEPHNPGYDRVKYALQPDMPPLDTDAGGRFLASIVTELAVDYPDCEIVVILDSIARAVTGPENDADTIRDFYQYTGTTLKREHITLVRLDNAGKDPERGARGSSAKTDDVDIVWSLRETDNGVELVRMRSRLGWVPERVKFDRMEDPLRHVQVSESYPPGTKEVADLLDRLGVPANASTRDAQRLARSAGMPTRRKLVVAAQRMRRQTSEDASRGAVPSNHGNHAEPHSESPREPDADIPF